jgi:copper homeostasis protein
MALVEICTEDLSGVRAARAGGAARAELCTALSEGGLSPGVGNLALACVRGGLPIVALVRARTGDFLAEAEELEAMQADVRAARLAGASAIAVGVLTADGRIAGEALAGLAALARPMEVVVHRAFDGARDLDEALEELVELGIERVLSAGGARTAWEGRARLAALVRRAGDRIQVVAAGGIRPDHARSLVSCTGVAAIHASAGATRPSAMRYRNPALRLASLESAAAPHPYERRATSEEAVRALVEAVNGAGAA